ncbi:hypothetical protein AAHC03_016766 [Spirometra sp. Aus1]
MDSTLAGRSYKSDRPTEFELNTLNDADSSSSNRKTNGSGIHHSVSAVPKSDSTVPEVNTRRRKIKSPQYSSTNSLQMEEAELVTPETNMMIQRIKRSFHAALPQRSEVTSSSSRARLCRWRIVADSNEHIKIRFTYMDMILPANSSRSGGRPNTDKQPLASNPDAYHECRAEYVEVHDGYYGNSVLLGRYCGTSIPPPLLSTRSRVWIEYRSPAVSSGSGFVAEYEVVCGGQIKGNNGTISSPSYPNPYPPNKECTWKIKVPARSFITLTFNSFDIEQQANCTYDYLEIYDGSSRKSPLLQRLCGNVVPQPVRSTGNTMFLKFACDSSIQKPGFSASFEKGKRPYLPP